MLARAIPTKTHANFIRAVKKDSVEYDNPTLGLWHITMANHAIPDICKLLYCADTYLKEEKYSKSSFGSKSDTFWQDTSSIKHPLDKTSISHHFDTTRNHGLGFMAANLLRPKFTIEKYSLPRNKNQHLKLPCLALDRQQPGCWVYVQFNTEQLQ